MAETSRFSNTEGAVSEPWLEVHTVTAAEDTAGTLSITTRFNVITGYVVVAYNSSGRKLADQFDYSTSGGTLTIADGGTSPASTNVIHATIWGRGGR